MNNLIIFESIESLHKVFSPKKKRSCLSFLPIVPEACLQYYQKKHAGLSVLTFPKNKATEFIFDEKINNFHSSASSLMQVRSIPQSVSSWTGFQTLACDSFPGLRITNGYLDCTDASTAEMSTIYQVK